MRAEARYGRRKYHKKSEITNKISKTTQILTHNKQKAMKKQYNEPQIYVENVVVESGIATSPGIWLDTPGMDGYDEFENGEY